MGNSSGNHSSLLPGNHSIGILRKTLYFKLASSRETVGLIRQYEHNNLAWKKQPRCTKVGMTTLLSYLVQHSCCAWLSRQGQGWQHGLSVVGAFTHQTLRGSIVLGKGGMSCLDTSLRGSPEHKHTHKQ